ncbi:MAG: hypothetical protein LBO77_00200 [Desulfovibrio sp.]|nr:hypothetical protein [Desulfovibrio sp.]
MNAPRAASGLFISALFWFGVCAGALAPPAAGAGASVKMPRICWLEEMGNAEHAAGRSAFVHALAKRPHRPELADFYGSAVTPEEMPEAARRLLQEEPDLILVSGIPALRALAAVNTGTIPVLALSPDCTAEALRDMGENGEIPPNFHLFPLGYWSARLDALRGAAGFTRPGLILPSADADRGVDAGRQALGSLLAVASNGVGGSGFEFFSVALSGDPDAVSCREAVDDLFFEEIDALLLDASGCFDACRNGSEELSLLLRQRGILPLSLTEAEAVRQGALLAPWQGEADRLGRLEALMLQPYFDTGTDFASALSSFLQADSERQRVLELMAGQSAYSLNMDVAETMGFEPAAALLARVREFFGKKENPLCPQ